MHSSHKYSSEWKSLFPGLFPGLRAVFEIKSKDKGLFLHGCGCEENAVPIIKLEVFYMRENKEQL